MSHEETFAYNQSYKPSDYNITCSGNQPTYNCFVNTSLIEGIYDITLTVIDNVGYSRTYIVNTSIFEGVIATDYNPSLTMNFSNQSDISNVLNPYLGIIGIAQINWYDIIDMSGYNLNTYIDLLSNYVYVNSTSLTNLNTDAVITMYNLSYEKNPVIYKDYSLCSSPNCNLMSYVPGSGTLTFNVTGFSTYTTGDNSRLSIESDGDYFINRRISFMANYTNTTFGSSIGDNATCIISYNDTPSTWDDMNYNYSSDIFNYIRKFNNAGNYQYNINCSHAEYETIYAMNNLSIDSGVMPIMWPYPYSIDNLSINIIGYTNDFGLLNLSVYEEGFPSNSMNFTDGDNGFGSKFNTVLTYNTTYNGTSYTGANYSIIRIPEGALSNINIDDGLSFESHTRDYYKYYTVVDKIVHSSLYYDLINITPAIEGIVPSSDHLYFYSESYPLGWFNISFNISYRGPDFITDISTYVLDLYQGISTYQVRYQELNLTPSYTDIELWPWSESTTNDSITFIGYTGNSNLTTLNVTVYITNPYQSSTFAVTTLNLSDNKLGNYEIIYDYVINDTVIIVNDSDNVLNDSLWFQFSNHDYTNFTRYNITSVSPYVGDYKRINISPPLINEIDNTESVTAYNNQYYEGWFTITPSLYEYKVNNMHFKAYSGVLESNSLDIEILHTNNDETITWSDYENSWTTNFTSLLDIENIYEPQIGIDPYAIINWVNKTINMSGGYDLDNFTNISYNYIYINSSALPNLNTSATITFYGLPYNMTPILYTRETNDNTSAWSLCSDCKIVNYNSTSKVLTFNVTGFSAYTSGNNSNLIIYDQNDDEGGSIPAYVNKTITFYANYSNTTNDMIENATCLLTFENGSVYSMIEDSDLYYFNYTFSTAILLNYNVSCNHSSYEKLVASDTINLVNQEFQIPILWDLPQFTTESQIDIIGHVNMTNVSVNVFTEGIPFYNSTVTITENVPIFGISYIFDLSTNDSNIIVPYDDRDLFEVGRYVYFEGHERQYFSGYNITNVINAPDNSYTSVSISTALVDTVMLGEIITVTNSSKPQGYFNVTLDLFSGNNTIMAYAYDSYYQGANSLPQEIYYNTGKPIFNLSYIDNMTGENLTLFEFLIVDSIDLNLTTLLINITNTSGYSTYYAHNTNDFNLTIIDNISCTGLGNDTFCNVVIEFNESGNYSVVFSVANLAGNYSDNSFNSINDYIVDLVSPNPVLNVSIGAFSTNKNIWNISWIAPTVVPYSGIDHYEYAIGTSIGDNNTYGWNSTSSTQVITGPMNLVSNTEYYISVKVISNSNRTSNISYTTITFYDDNGPIINNVNQSVRYTNEDSYLDVTWDAVDNESEITKFDVIVTMNEPYPWQNDSNIVVSKTISDGLARTERIYFSLENNITYYTTIWGTNILGYPSETPGYNIIGTTYDSTAPENISISYEAGNITDGQITLEINPGYDRISGISKYIIDVYKTDYVNGVCSGTSSFTVFNETTYPAYIQEPSDQNITFDLDNGYCYQFRLRVQNNAGSFSTYGDGLTAIGNITVDTTSPDDFNVYDTVGSIGDKGLLTLSGNSLTITWNETKDDQSDLIRYELWMTEESFGMGEQPFGAYSQGNPLNLTLSNITRYGDLLSYTLTNLNMNLSNETDVIHQYKYRVYVKAINGQGLFTTENSNGILYIDNVGPTLSVIYVENVSINSTPYYDSVNNGNTTIVVEGEQFMTCVWSDNDEGYQEIPANGGSCTVTGSNATCRIPENNEGYHNYHISCKDMNGVKNTALTNLDLNVLVDYTGPIINIITPNETNYSDGVYVDGDLIKYNNNTLTFNFTATDYAFNQAWIQLNASGEIVLEEKIDASETDSGTYYFNYTDDILNYNKTHTFYINDKIEVNNRNITLLDVYDTDNAVIKISNTVLENAYLGTEININGRTINITYINYYENPDYRNAGIKYNGATYHVKIDEQFEEMTIRNITQDYVTFAYLYEETSTISKLVPEDVNGLRIELTDNYYDVESSKRNATIKIHDVNIEDEFFPLIFTVYANDTFGHVSNESFNFTYDGTSPNLEILMANITYNESFNFTLDGKNIRNITWNITPTSNLSLSIMNGTIDYNILNESFAIDNFVNITSLADNNYTIIAHYNNDFNITNNVTKTFILDTTAPVINMPIYYLPQDYVFKYNDTLSILGHNFTILNIQDYEILVNIDDEYNFTLDHFRDDSYPKSINLTDYDGIIVDFDYFKEIYNIGYRDSFIILKVYNKTIDIPTNYNLYTNEEFYDRDLNHLYISETLKSDLSVQDLTNLDVDYKVYDTGNKDAIRVSGNLNAYEIIEDEFLYHLSAYLDSLPFKENKNLTLEIMATDEFGYTSTEHMNFTFIKYDTEMVAINFSNIDYIENNQLFTNDNVSINIICNNSNEIRVGLYAQYNQLLKSWNISGSDIINWSLDINYPFNNTMDGYYIGAYCLNELYDYDKYYYSYYYLKYDNRSPYAEFVEVVDVNNSEYFIEDGDSVYIDGIKVSIENITENSAMFQVENHIFKNISVGENVTFYSGDYMIRLLKTYYNEFYEYNHFASFRFIESPDIEKEYPITIDNLFINTSSNRFIYMPGELNIYYLVDDDNDLNPNSTIIDLIRINDSKILMNDSELNDSVYYGYMVPYEEVGHYFFNLTINLSELTSTIDYQLRLNVTDLLSQSTITTYNFTYYDANLELNITPEKSEIFKNESINLTINYRNLGRIILNITDSNNQSVYVNTFNTNMSDSINSLIIQLNETNFTSLQNLNYSLEVIGFDFLDHNITANNMFKVYNDKYEYDMKVGDNISINLSIAVSDISGLNFTNVNSSNFNIEINETTRIATITALSAGEGHIIFSATNGTDNFTGDNIAIHITNVAKPKDDNPAGGSSRGSSSSGGSMGGIISTTKETCIDGIKNQDEKGVDCDGVCEGYWYSNGCHKSPKPTCRDNIKNQGEDDVDCGGPCSNSCPETEEPKIVLSCNDKIKNQNELGIDCGGICGGYWYDNSCHPSRKSTCSDGIKNQDEKDIDCGGKCLNKCKSEGFGLFGTLAFILGGIVIIGGGAAAFLFSRRHGQTFDYKSPTSVTDNNANPKPDLDLNKTPKEIDGLIHHDPINDIKEIKHSHHISAKSNSDLDMLIKFIDDSQGKGILNSKIKIKLLNTGWPQSLIDEAFERTECSKKLIELDKFIKHAKAKGHSHELIRNHLISANWSEHFIDMVLHDVHIIHEDYEKVKLYAWNMMKKGHNRSDIIKILTDVGWNRNDIEPYVNE